MKYINKKVIKEFNNEFNIADVGADTEICFLKSEIQDFIDQKITECKEEIVKELRTKCVYAETEPYGHIVLPADKLLGILEKNE